MQQLVLLKAPRGTCRDSPDLQELRGRIIQVFFKHLTSSNEVAVDMSQEGLAAVIAYQKMPKTLLQVRSKAPCQLCADPSPHAPSIPSLSCRRLWEVSMWCQTGVTYIRPCVLDICEQMRGKASRLVTQW